MHTSCKRKSISQKPCQAHSPTVAPQMSLSEARSSGESLQRRRRSPSGTEAIDRSRNSIHGLNSILNEFEELWQKSNLHARSQSDVLPATDAHPHEADRRTFSAPLNYSYKNYSSSDCFETANEGEVPYVASPMQSSDENLVLASSEPQRDLRKLSWSDHTEEGEVRRHMPRLRDNRVSLHSHRASVHGGSIDLNEHTPLRTPSKVPKEPPPAVPSVTPLSSRIKKVALPDDDKMTMPTTTTTTTTPTPTPQRRKPSGPRPAPTQERPPLIDLDQGQVPEPPRRSSKRKIKRRNFRQSSIENLLETKPDYTLDEFKLPAAERQLLNRFVDTLSKITVEIDLDEGKRPEARRRLNNALRALEGWI